MPEPSSPPATAGDEDRSPEPPEHGLGVALARWRPVLVVARRHVTRDRISVAAGSLAFHGFMAFFPAVIAALGLLTLAHISPDTLHHLIHAITKALPAGSSDVVTAAVDAATKKSSGSTTAVVVGTLVALWSASSATAVLQQALDVAYEVSTDRKYLVRRLRAIPLMALIFLGGGLSAALIVFGQPIGSAIEGALSAHGIPFTVVWTAFRWVVTLVVISLVFSGIYRLGPNRKSQWRWVSPGSLVATAGFLVASLGFSFYVSAFGSYGKTYGSFAGVAIFIFWMYLIALALLVGGELNAAADRRDATPTGISSVYIDPLY